MKSLESSNINKHAGNDETLAYNTSDERRLTNCLR